MRGNQLALTLGLLGAGSWLALRAYRQATAYNFAGKNVLITGGSRGLGLVLARQLLSEGARVAVCARDERELERAEADLADYGAATTFVCDITDQRQVERLVHDFRERFGFVDVLINNAGTITAGPVEDMTVADFEQAMNINFWGAVYASLAVIPEMRERREGRIVNISSIGGKIGVPHLVPYSASKFALTGLSEGLRAELAKDGIVVTTVCPGLMRTGSPRNALFKGQHRAEYAWFSIADALPGMSMSAERAARRIVNACRRGDAQVVLSLPAQFAVLLHGLFPGLVTDLSAIVNRLLPGPGGGAHALRGKDSESSWSPSWLTVLGDRAALRNNEVDVSGR